MRVRVPPRVLLSCCNLIAFGSWPPRNQLHSTPWLLCPLLPFAALLLSCSCCCASSMTRSLSSLLSGCALVGALILLRTPCSPPQPRPPLSGMQHPVAFLLPLPLPLPSLNCKVAARTPSRRSSNFAIWGGKGGGGLGAAAQSNPPPTPRKAKRSKKSEGNLECLTGDVACLASKQSWPGYVTSPTARVA